MTVDFNPYGAPVADSLGRSLLATPFNLLAVANERPVIQVMFPYYIDTADDVTVTVTGSGASSQAHGLGVFTTGATANSTIIVETQDFVQYRPGQGVIARMSGFVTATPPATARVAQGVLSSQDGFAFAWNGNTPSILHRRSGAGDTYVDRAHWNVDKVDGTGPSGFNWTPTFGSPLAIAYQWLGVGTTWFFIYDEDNPILVHKIKWGNANTGVSLISPSLPMRVEVSNGATAQAVTMNVPCLMASVFGEDTPANHHPFSGGNPYVTLSGTSETFIAAFTSKATFSGKTNRIITQPQNFSLASVAQRTTFRLYKRNASTGLTGTSFADVDTTNSCMQVSTAGTFVNTGWRQVRGFVVEAGGNLIFTPESGELILKPGEYWVLTAQGGANGAIAGGFINWNEER